MELVKNQVVELAYRTRDLGYGVEEDIITAYWNGDIDAWGKYTIVPTNAAPVLYLFRDEIESVETAPAYFDFSDIVDPFGRL